MPTTQASTSLSPDHRIFGFLPDGRVQVNLYHGAGHPYAGRRYCWSEAASPEQLASRLERQFEQTLTDEDWDVLDQLEWSRIPCDTCAGSGADPGGLNPYGEPCPDCHGSGIEPMLITLRRRVAAIEASLRSAKREAA